MAIADPNLAKRIAKIGNHVINNKHVYLLTAWRIRILSIEVKIQTRFPSLHSADTEEQTDDQIY